MRATLRLRVFTGLMLLPFLCAVVRAQEPKSVKGAAASDRKHRATLRWQPSPDAKKHKSAKYWIYRAKGHRNPDGHPACGSDYKMYAIVDTSVNTYVDDKVEANQVYCYYVITVTGKSKKDRSKPTPTVIAVIPQDKPNP